MSEKPKHNDPDRGEAIDANDDLLDGEAVADAELASEDSIDQVLNLQAEVDALRAEKHAFMEKLARVQADFANSRRRLEADAEQRHAYANESLVRTLLPVIDNFDRALAQDVSKIDTNDLLKGIALVREQLRTALVGQSVEEIAPRSGDAFDPNQHQALIQQPSDLPEGSITQLLQKGFSMKGRVIRPAQVAVAASK